MREGFDREMDSLLRRAARAPAGARGNGASGAKPDTHLDADELAAFAEGALPEAARMNTVSHLADCGECRALAANLTRAAGVEVKLEKHAVAASPARESGPKRGWLAAIFAPRTLRYVAPALVVCLVAAVSFVALRSRSDGGLISLRGPGNESASPSVTSIQNNSQPAPEGQANANAPANANTSTTATGADDAAYKVKSNAEAADAPVVQPSNKDAGDDKPDGSAPGSPAESKAVGEVATAQPAAKEEDSADSPPVPREAAKAAPVAEVPAPKSADNMKAGPPPPAQTADELAYNNESQAQKRAAQRGLEPQAPDGGARQRSAGNNSTGGGGLASTQREDRDARLGRSERAPSTRRGGRSNQGVASDSDREGAQEESRAVAGRRFRRERGAWVDVNYKPSMPLKGVRRGTDYFRSLVADMPDLGRVAGQLGGEVIVVVGGRAYRIQ